MKRLELKQGLSYAVGGFSCVKGVPFDVEDNIAKSLLSTGRFVELQCVDDIDEEMDDDPEDFLNMFGKQPAENENNVPENKNDTAENENDTAENENNAKQTYNVPDMAGDSKSVSKELSADGVAKLKKAELEALAAEKNIDISDCSNNEERVAKICGVLGLASTVRM